MVLLANGVSPKTRQIASFIKSSQVKSDSRFQNDQGIKKQTFIGFNCNSTIRIAKQWFFKSFVSQNFIGFRSKKTKVYSDASSSLHNCYQTALEAPTRDTMEAD